MRAKAWERIDAAFHFHSHDFRPGVGARFLDGNDAERRGALRLCSVADTSFGRWAFAQDAVDRMVRNMADAVTLDRTDRAYLAKRASPHVKRSRHALAQLDDWAQAEREASPQG